MVVVVTQISARAAGDTELPVRAGVSLAGVGLVAAAVVEGEVALVVLLGLVGTYVGTDWVGGGGLAYPACWAGLEVLVVVVVVHVCAGAAGDAEVPG